MKTQSINQTPLLLAIKSFEAKYLIEFKPQKALYERLKINRIRFWQLVEGVKTADINEAKVLSEYFGISINDLF